MRFLTHAWSEFPDAMQSGQTTALNCRRAFVGYFGSRGRERIEYRSRPSTGNGTVRAGYVRAVLPAARRPAQGRPSPPFRSLPHACPEHVYRSLVCFPHTSIFWGRTSVLAAWQRPFFVMYRVAAICLQETPPDDRSAGLVDLSILCFSCSQLPYAGAHFPLPDSR